MVTCKSWLLTEFPSILRAILDNTPESDNGLQNAALRICAEKVKDVLTNRSWAEYLAENGEIAVVIMTALDSKHDRQKAVLEGKLKGLQRAWGSGLITMRSWLKILCLPNGDCPDSPRTVFLYGLLDFKTLMLELEHDIRNFSLPAAGCKTRFGTSRKQAAYF